MAYQNMPIAYVYSQFADAIKPTDKIYMGFDSLSGGQLSLLNLNQLMALGAENASE
jgi:hypothetical protein